MKQVDDIRTDVIAGRSMRGPFAPVDPRATK